MVHTGRDAALRKHAPLVRRIAGQIIRRVPANVELDDMIQAGMIGLNDALERFDAARGVQFETFATQRIRGAMLDELRGTDWMSRGDRRQIRAMDAATQRLEHTLGRAPAEADVAQAMGMPLADLQAIKSSLHMACATSLDDEPMFEIPADAAAEPDAVLEDKRRRAAVAEAMRWLPERERAVLDMHYETDLTLREIGVVFGVTESRACQIEAQAIARLRILIGRIPPRKVTLPEPSTPKQKPRVDLLDMSDILNVSAAARERFFR